MKNLLLLDNSQNKKYIWMGFILIILSICLQVHSNLDYFIQQSFFDIDQKTWWIHETDFSKFILYTLPKVLLIIASMALIHYKYKTFDPYKGKKIIAFLFCMAVIPFLITLLKSNTNIHCPYDLNDFGGNVPFRSVLDFNSYKQILSLYGNGNCFPSGHASGGYAFMSTYFLLNDRTKKNGIIFGFLLGTYMGLYQMLKGAHFFSHTLFTFGFSILIISLVHLWLNKET